MGIIYTTKFKAIRALINTWLKDQRVYCNNCGMVAIPELLARESCCEDPQLGRNIEHYVGCTKQNKIRKESQLKATGATENNQFRYAVSMPPQLVTFLEDHFAKYNEKLFNNPKELHGFMKEFPMFAVCEKV